jgi:hypothetical protein
MNIIEFEDGFRWTIKGIEYEKKRNGRRRTWYSPGHSQPFLHLKTALDLFNEFIYHRYASRMDPIMNDKLEMKEESKLRIG